MKQSVSILLALLISIMLLSTAAAAPAPSPKFGAKVDKDILKEMAKGDGKGFVKVIVVLREPKDGKGKVKAAEAEGIRKSAISKVGKEKTKHQFLSFNGFSATLDEEGIKKLESDPDVEAVYYDHPVHALLQQSVPLVNATSAWAIQVNGVNLTGRDISVCIIDTGVNYSHPDLRGAGNCTISTNTSLNGNVVNYTLESSHPYGNSTSQVWKINYTGFTKIAVHFKNISTESGYDYIYIKNGSNSTIATYSGSFTDIWTSSSYGDTIYVNLTTDNSVTGYGFYIDQVINGTVNTTSTWNNCTKVIYGYDFVNLDADPADDDGHGTHVTGIVAANGTIKGVAPEAKIVAVKVLDENGYGFDSDIIAGIDFCTNYSSQYNISVISMSLGGSLYTGYCDSSETGTRDAINAAIAKNISVVAATGNDYSSTKIGSPACIRNSTAVGSVTKSDVISSFSNRNNITDLLAPGSSINSTSMAGDYTIKSGTSMATPHVAGAFAIIYQYGRLQGVNFTPGQIENAFKATGKIINDSGYSNLTYPRIDIYSAALSLDSIPPTITVNSPVPGSTTNDSTPLVNITLNGTGTRIRLAVISINNTQYIYNSTTGNATENTANCQNLSANSEIVNCAFNSLALVDGFYILNVTAYDNAAASNANTSLTNFTSNAPPTIIGIALNDSYVKPNATVLLTVNVTDPNLANSTANGQLLNCTASGANNTCMGYFNLTASGNFNVTVCDLAGQCAQDNSTTYIVDGIPPVINNASMNNTYISNRTAVLVTVNATDNLWVRDVTASGIGLNQSGINGSIWNSTITLSGADGQFNFTIVAYDNASNQANTTLYYTIDNTPPVITITAPANFTNGSTMISGNGTLEFNWTVSEANLTSTNISLDNGAWTNSSTSNGTNSVTFAGIATGTHTLAVSAYDRAGWSSSTTLSFIMSAPLNTTKAREDMRSSVGNATLTNVSLKDATNTSIDYSTNDTLNASALSLNLELVVNASAVNVTVTIPTFNGSSANWNATNFSITTNATGSVGTNAASNTRLNITILVSFVDMGRFLANDGYGNGTVVVFPMALNATNGQEVLYIADDVGSSVYRLSSCLGGIVPSIVNLSTMCYLNTSSNVITYIPHLSGVALANDTTLPVINITSPMNNTAASNSYFTFTFDAWEANPNTNNQFCWYNLTNASGQAGSNAGPLVTPSPVGNKYSFSQVLAGLRNGSYNITVNCTDIYNQSTQVYHNFTANDTTNPAITSIGSSTAGAAVTLSVTTDEIAECKYSTSDTNFSIMSAMSSTNSTSHSNSITYGATTSGTYYVRCNDTAGNTINASNSTPFSVTITPPCSPSWSCTSWSSCQSSGTQTKTCTDQNSCGTNSGKPAESQSCTYVAPVTVAPYTPPATIPTSPPICSATCPTGYTQNAYPDCGCVAPVQQPNATSIPIGPANITITPTRTGAVANISHIMAGKPVTVNASSAISDVTGILNITITPRRDLTQVNVDFRKLDTVPANITEPLKDTYRYLEINATNTEQIDLISAKVAFRVEKLWIGKKYNVSTVALMRYASEEWATLDTQLVNQTESYYIFEATTPGFSYFAITAEENLPPASPIPSPQSNLTNVTQPPQSFITPSTVIGVILFALGFIILVELLAIAYAYLASKKQEGGQQKEGKQEKQDDKNKAKPESKSESKPEGKTQAEGENPPGTGKILHPDVDLESVFPAKK